MRLSRIHGLLTVLGIVAAWGCATTGATFRSGVSDTFLEHAPWYAGERGGDSAVAHLPIVYQRGGSQSEMFDPRANPGSPVAALLAEMNAYLDSLVSGPRLEARPLPGTPPDVQFGCEVDAAGECTNGPAAPFEFGSPRMRLAVGRPSADWTAAVAAALAERGAARVIVLTLEVGQYWPVQTNWRGSKAVELGTNHRADLPWLTSLETPVTVLQLTGAMMDRDGRALRIGAEGLLAKRTGIVAAGFGMQAVLSDEDVQQMRTGRREELPGRPLVWQAALRTLVAQLADAAASAN
ncbi:MAG TPA: hypothetical protein VFZ69_16770 [Longimicrobiales bacterium]